uniref:AlNc14C358G10966 protein n=1 Tax=Albugo laibachii Nc14 TaxID=890382 RepID=F0WXL5_9STRA|nr:AlNc14C358G10966 [Albugo laibachii Nc14]|eukprot:CCA26209.1 AlNc14C358G10966 [Albugo laibachii Nc14]
MVCISGTRHEFILAYCPCRNGSLERVADITMTLQANPNLTPVKPLGMRTPVEYLTGMKSLSVIDRVFLPEDMVNPVVLDMANIEEDMESLKLYSNRCIVK